MNDVQIMNLITDALGETKSRRSQESLMLQYGFIRLGSGVSATAYRHLTDQNKVVRLSQDGQEYAEDDWASFALFAMENPCPVMPVIHSMRKVGPHLVITIMEKLKENWEIGREAEDAMRREWQEDWELRAQSVPAFRECMPVLRKMVAELGLPDDLWKANYMMRGDQLVITDPYHGQGSRGNKYRLSRYPVGKRTQVEVTTHEQQLEDRAILAQLREGIAVRPEAKDQMLRRQPFFAGEPRPERIPGALLPRKSGLRGLHPARFVDFARLERAAFADLARINDGLNPQLVRRWFDPITIEHIVEIDGVRHRAGDQFARLDMAQPVRYIPEGIEPVFHVNRPEGRTVSVPNIRKKRWEAAVPCQKAVAEERRRRAEVHRKLSERAA